MKRERALKIVLVLVGLLFCAAVYPLALMAKQDPALAMMMSLYATLGVFLPWCLAFQIQMRGLIARYRTYRLGRVTCVESRCGAVV